MKLSNKRKNKSKTEEYLSCLFQIKAIILIFSEFVCVICFDFSATLDSAQGLLLYMPLEITSGGLRDHLRHWALNLGQPVQPGHWEKRAYLGRPHDMDDHNRQWWEQLELLNGWVPDCTELHQTLQPHQKHPDVHQDLRIGQSPFNHNVLQEAYALCQCLPLINTKKFKTDF